VAAAGGIEPLRELGELAQGWRLVKGRSVRRLAVSAVSFVTVLALLVARRGTFGARVGAAVAVVGGALLALTWAVVERRRARRPEAVLRGPARSVDAGRADRALRALTLLGPDGEGRDAATSVDLARAHVARVLADLPAGRIAERWSQVAARTTAAALAAAVCVIGLGLANAWSVLEGADVLLARGGIAPATMRWLDEVDLTARPPDYLREPEIREMAAGPLVLPNGTLLTVKGRPLHAGRRLLLSDGSVEVPFVEDGASELVARWPLDPGRSEPSSGPRRAAVDVKLRVVARFGDVTVPEPDALEVAVVLDAAPVVKLEGAPRRLALAEQVDDVPIKYEATDDHGLREVQLVLRCGASEDRRVLSHLDGEATSDQGGQTLRLRDPFVKKCHAPIEVTVEAKDNDPLTGPKWGASPAITLVPPDIGEPEAERLEEFKKVRDALVDRLAERLRGDFPAGAAQRKTLAADDGAKVRADDALLDRALRAVHGGIRVPSGVRAMLVAQQQSMRKAIGAQVQSPTPANHAAVVKATERFVLVIDAVIRGLGLRDARESARQLADVADDLAVGNLQMQSDDADTRTRGAARADAARLVLAAGGTAIRRLGTLGWDLGEIVEADLARVDRGRRGEDLIHAELAARDLAARLRQPDPSFGARGGRMGLGGSEGGGAGASGQEGESDEVEQAFREAAQELERLTQDHGGQVGKTEEALAGGTSDDELGRMREEAKRHAEAVREAVRALPSIGTGSQSWTSKGAAGREFAEQMARSLEQGRSEEAVESGRSALGSLDGARDMLRKGSPQDVGQHDGARVDDARGRLAAEQRWAEEQLRQMRRRAAERARGQLEEGGREEDKLADRALDLAHKSRQSGSFPEQAVESLGDAERAARQAAQALKQGDAERGLQQQREAQRALEAAREQLDANDDDGGSGASDDGDSRSSNERGRFEWSKNEHKGPEDFRRRVMRGLAQPTKGSLKDAVRRYAEGLLR